LCPRINSASPSIALAEQRSQQPVET